MRVVFVHGACVRDGAWWWHRAAEVLQRQGIPSVAAALPSCGETGLTPGPDGPGLPEDVAAVRALLAADGEPAVVVAHSYGGIVAAEAAAGVTSVRHLLLVSSYLPEVGESLGTFGGETPAPFLEIDGGAGTFGVSADALGPVFLQDCDAGVVAEALPRRASQSLQVTQQPVQAAAWHDFPSTYLECAQDLGTPADRQRVFAERAGAVVELDAGHHPFLSQPDAVAELVRGLG